MNISAKRIMHFLVSEDGPTSVEYAVMLALIVVVCLATITQVGSNTNDTYVNVRNALAGP